MKGLKFFFCLIALSSAGPIAYTMPRHSSVLESDTLRPLIPAGVFLSIEGFRLVLDERIRLLECEQLKAGRDTTINKLVNSLSVLQFENSMLRANDAVHRENTKELKKKLLGKSVSSSLGWGVAIGLAIKLIF